MCTACGSVKKIIKTVFFDELKARVILIGFMLYGISFSHILKVDLNVDGCSLSLVRYKYIKFL